MRGDVGAQQENCSGPFSSAACKGPGGGRGTARVTPILLGRVLGGTAVVWSVMGRVVGPFFHCKRNFRGFLLKPKVKERAVVPRGGQVWGISVGLRLSCIKP